MINIINHVINIDLANKINMNQSINIKKNDTNSHKFIINMFNSGASHSLTGTTAKIYFKKFDGTKVFLSCVLDGTLNNRLSAVLTTQALTSAGNVACEITVYGTSGEILTSNSFNFTVIENIRDDAAVESTSEFTALVDALAVVTTISNKLDKTEFDTFKDSTDVQLANIVPQVASNTSAIQTAISGSPRNTYATLTDLQTAHPTDDGFNYLVSVNNHIYDWISGAWTDTNVEFLSTPIADGGVGTIKVADKAITIEKMEFASKGKNLFDKSFVTVGYNIQYTTGILIVSANYSVSDYMPIKNGVTYAITKCRQYAFYNTSKVFVSGVDVTAYVPVTFTATADGYLRYCTGNTYIDTSQFEVGSVSTAYEAYKIAIDRLILKNINLDNQIVENKNLKDADIQFGKLAGNIPLEKMSFVSFGKNLFDKSKRTLGYNIQYTTGILTANVSYDTSDYILIKSGVTYTINKCRQYALYNTLKVYVSGVDNGAYGSLTFTATADGYLRLATGIAFIDTAQVEIGTVATVYESYNFKLQYLEFDDIQKQKIISMVSSEATKSNKVTVYKNGTNYKIRSIFDSVNDIVIETTSNGSSNGSFRFETTYLMPKGSEDFNLKEIIHANSFDDITPIRTFYTVGANHGYTSLQVDVTGFTSADLGSKWTDGVSTFTMVKATSSYVTLIPEYIVDGNGITSAKVATSIADLTHVSGATNTTTIPTTGRTYPNLYPSINNNSVKYILDGLEIITDGTYYGEELQVQQSYNIIDYKALIDYAQANIGVSYENNIVEGAVRLSINYCFTEKGAVAINHNFRALKRVIIGDCGFLQSYPMGLTGHKIHRYLPNVLSKSGFDFKNIVDMTTYNLSLLFTPSDYANASIPPHRHVDWLKNTTTSVKKIGFALGYLIDKTNSKHSDRLLNTTRAWDMRDTTKSYPIALTSKTLEVGQYYNISGYRNYLSPLWDSQVTDCYIVKDKKDTYVYLDLHENVSFKNIKLDEYIGKSITIVESENFTLTNNVVDADGVTFSIINNYGYAVLKLS